MFLWPKGQKFPELKNAHKIFLFLNNSSVGGFEEGKSVWHEDFTVDYVRCKSIPVTANKPEVFEI